MCVRWVLWVAVLGLLFVFGCSNRGVVAPAAAPEGPSPEPAGVWADRSSEPTTWSELKEMYREAEANRPPKIDG